MPEERQLKGCGYFGCHVLNDGECECTKCDMQTGRCQTCNAFPNRVRKDGWLAEAMKEKCEACKNLNPRQPRG